MGWGCGLCWVFEVKLVCKRLLTLTSGSGKLVKVVCGLGLWLVACAGCFKEAGMLVGVVGVLRLLVC